jgi:hypothetical protein
MLNAQFAVLIVSGLKTGSQMSQQVKVRLAAVVLINKVVNCVKEVSYTRELFQAESPNSQ